jgi:hypothetical protein
MVLECELADPTPFSISPGDDTVSSAGGAVESVLVILLSPAGRVEPAFSTAGCEDTTALSAARCLLVDSKICGLDFSRSFALSLAARGADGKNCAKLAPDARDIVGQILIYLTRRPPTIISIMVFRERLHA